MDILPSIIADQSPKFEKNCVMNGLLLRSSLCCIVGVALATVFQSNAGAKSDRAEDTHVIINRSIVSNS